MVGVFTPQKWANATSQSLFFSLGNSIVKHLTSTPLTLPISTYIYLEKRKADWRGNSSINQGVRQEEISVPPVPVFYDSVILMILLYGHIAEENLAQKNLLAGNFSTASTFLTWTSFCCNSVLLMSRAWDSPCNVSDLDSIVATQGYTKHY